MKHLKNRNIAILITAIAAFISMQVCVRRSTDRITNEIEALFYDGIYVQQDKYTLPSINSQLERIVATALNTATLLQSRSEFEESTELLLQERRNLLTAEGIDKKSLALADINQAFHALVAAAFASTDLTAREIDAITQYLQTFEGAYTYINTTLAPAYNSIVDDFHSERSILAELVYRRSPDHFPISIC